MRSAKNPKFLLVTAPENEYSESEDHRMAGQKVEVSISVGDLKPSPEQAARLKALVESQVLTWVKADLYDNRPTAVVCCEDMSANKDE